MDSYTVFDSRAAGGYCSVDSPAAANGGRAASPAAASAGSSDPRGSLAGREAVEQALAGAGGSASLVLLFASPRADVAGLAEAAQRAAGGVPVAGCTSAGEILDGEAGQGTVAALAVPADVRCAVGEAERAAGGLRGAARRACSRALAGVDPDAGHPLLLLLLDPRSDDQWLAVAGAYEAAGPAVPLAGCAAGGADPALIVAGRRLEDAVVAVALVSPRAIGLGIGAGCSRFGVPSVVTRAEGRTLLELDGRPAEEVYLEKHGNAAEAGLDDECFERFAALHPLAQPEPSGRLRFRHVLGRDGAGGLHATTCIPADAAVEFTAQSPEDVVRSSETAAAGAVAALGGAAPRAALAFDCAGRKRAAGPALVREAAALRRGLGSGIPLAGLYCHGEIGRVRGTRGDLNHAVVVVAFA